MNKNIVMGALLLVFGYSVNAQETIREQLENARQVKKLTLDTDNAICEDANNLYNKANTGHFKDLLRIEKYKYNKYRLQDFTSMAIYSQIIECMKKAEESGNPEKHIANQCYDSLNYEELYNPEFDNRIVEIFDLTEIIDTELANIGRQHFGRN